MDDLEQKLKHYYDSLEMDDEFRRKLLALETCSEAKPPKPRGRYVLPIAAAVAAVVALGSCWAYLRSSMSGNLPAPAYAAPVEATSPAPVGDEAPSAKPPAASGASTAPAVQTPQTSEQPSAEHAQPTPDPAAEPKADVPPVGSEPPAEEPTPHSAAEPPKDVTPQAPEVEPMPHAAVDPPQTPAVEPPPEVPPEPGSAGGPPEEVPTVSPFDTPYVVAQYRFDGTQETLLLSNGWTGETVSIDVTGILPKAPARPASIDSEAAAAASESPMGYYSGTTTAFGWQISFTLQGYRDSAYAVAIAESKIE